MHTFPELFHEFERRVLPAQLTDAGILQLRHEAFALDLAASARADLGGEDDHFVYIATGATKLVAYLSGSREQIIAFGFPGELMHVPGPSRRSFALVALEPTELLAIPAKSLLASAARDCTLLRLATEQTMLALERSRTNSIILGTRSARERLASFLLDMFERTERGDLDPESIALPMSRSEIADNLGLTIETVSRQFSEMRQLGLIETCGRAVVHIRDWKGLSRAAGQMPVAA